MKTIEQTLIRFQEWMNEVSQHHPMRLETDNDDVAAMFLLENPEYAPTQSDKQTAEEMAEKYFAKDSFEYNQFVERLHEFSSQQKGEIDWCAEVIKTGLSLPKYDYGYKKYISALPQNIPIGEGVQGIESADMHETFQDACRGIINWYKLNQK